MELTTNIQYSTSSDVPRFDKLNDLSDEVCKMCDNNLLNIYIGIMVTKGF